MARKPITTWAQLTEDLDAEKKMLVEIEPAMEITTWQQEPDFPCCWYASWPKPDYSDGRVSRVKYNAEFLTSQTTLDLCNTNPSSYFLDAAAQLLYVHMPDSVNPANFTVAAFFWLYFSTHPKSIFIPAGGSLPVFYEHIVRTPPIYGATLNNDFFAAAATSIGSIELLNGATRDTGDIGPIDQIFYAYIWRGKTVRVLVGGEDLPYSEYKLATTGQISGQKKTTETAIFTVTEHPVLAKKLPSGTYKITDFPNLEPNAEGKPIPIILGTVYNISPTQIDTNTWTFKLCAHSITALTAVREDGVDITSNATVNLAAGTFTLTAYAGGQITCDCRGIDIDLYGQMAMALLTTYGGLLAANVDTTAMAQIDIDRPYAMGIFIAELKTIGDILSEMDESIMAWHGLNRTGQITARAWTEPNMSAPGAIPYDGDLDMRETQEEINFNKLYYQVKVGYQRNWTVQQNTSTAGMTITIGGITYTLDQTPKQDWSHTERWETADSNRCRYLYDCEETLPIHSLLTTKANAAAIATTYMTIMGSPWLDKKFKTQLKPLDQEIGDIAIINRARFCVAGGDKSMMITGLREGLSDNLAEVTAYKKV